MNRSRVINVILAVLVLIVVGMYLWTKYTNAKKEDKGIVKYYLPNDTLKRVRNPDSTELATIKAKLITAEMIKRSDDTVISRLRRELDQKGAELDAYILLKTTTEGAVKAPLKDTSIRIVDSVYYLVKSFSYKDRWLNATGIVGKDSVSFDYRLFNEFNIESSYRRTGFLKLNNTLYVSVHPLNPKTITTELQLYKIDKPRKRFYETNGFKIGVGLAAGFYLGRRVN